MGFQVELWENLLSEHKPNLKKNSNHKFCEPRERLIKASRNKEGKGKAYCSISLHPLKFPATGNKGKIPAREAMSAEERKKQHYHVPLSYS